jgi:UPF0288 family protein (methanogenesis marker protein 3)
MEEITLPVCEARFSILTSSPFRAGTVTGDAKVKVTNAKNEQAMMKNAKRDMENKWIGWHNGRTVGQVG